MTRRTDAGDCSVAEVTQVQHGNLDQEVQDKYLELVHLISRCHRLVLDLEGGGQFGVQLLQNPCHSPTLTPSSGELKQPLADSEIN